MSSLHSRTASIYALVASWSSWSVGTHFRRIIARAGLKPWPRLFHNLRASCATDWVERFPAHVVAGWLGHSPLVAARYYLQTRDAHFDLATGGAEGGAKSGAIGGGSSPADPELVALVLAWPALPEAVRKNILAMVKAANG